MSWNPPYVVLEPETRAGLAAYERVRELRVTIDLESIHTKAPVVRDVPGPSWADLLGRLEVPVASIEIRG